MPTKSNAAPQGFTPGPWRVGETSRHSDDMWDEVAIRNGTPGVVAAFVPVPDDEGRANAALIASAPDLLAENERLRGALEAYENAWHKFKDAPTEDCFTDEEKNALCDLGNASSLARATLAGGAK